MLVINPRTFTYLGESLSLTLYIHVLAPKLTFEDDPAPRIRVVPSGIHVVTGIDISTLTAYLPDPREGCDSDGEKGHVTGVPCP